MDREPRYVPPGLPLVEVTDVTVQNRLLLRPSEELNDLFVGVVGRAQCKYQMRICGVTALSSHYHMLLVPEDALQLAEFMCFVNTNLSKEIGRLHDWPGPLWADRYHHLLVSDEEAAQMARLKYVLSNGVKEFLVDRPAEWPGVHSVRALTEGKALVGRWYDRTKEHAARQLRGEKDVDPERFATEELLVLEPLPCWAHLPREEVRQRVAELVVEIEEEGARERERTGKRSLGVKKILRARPAQRPKKVEKSPKPRFHATTKAALERLREAFREIVLAYREASTRLRSGERSVEFPEGTFPPALPFVPFAEISMARARGQPA